MANLREALAVTTLASLEWSEERERAIDRVAACGKCSSLGVDLWKARYMNEVSAYGNAKRELLKICKARYSREQPLVLEKIVEQSLHEFLSPFCSTCNGAKEVLVGELKVLCPACDGVGVRRYGNEDRARMMNLSYGLTKFLARKLRWLLEEMTSLDREVNYQLNIELEREQKQP